MRQLSLVVLVVIAAAGCAAQGLPIEGGGGTVLGPGSPNAGNNSAPDMTKPLGGPGAMCQTACDCTPGLACAMGTCGMSMFGNIYCCESMDCPLGNFCQSSNGGFGQCSGNNGGGAGGGMGGGPGGGFGNGGDDGGAPANCRQIMCNSDTECTAAGCMVCGRRGFCR